MDVNYSLTYCDGEFVRILFLIPLLSVKYNVWISNSILRSFLKFNRKSDLRFSAS